ncbi:MAG: hypothetical protein ABSG81_09830 [Acidimicrobiales bacterium]
MTRRTKVLGSLGLVAALVGTGVGGLATGAFARAKRPVHTVAASTPVSTASLTFSAQVSGLTKRGATLSVTGSGQVDFANDAASLSVTLPAGLSSFLPGGSSSPAVIDVVLSGGTVYAEVPGLSALTGTPWISVALPSGVTSSLSGAFGTAASALGNVGAILAFVQSHHGHVVSLGSKTVNDVSASGDRITGQVDGFRVQADVWADSSNRVVQAGGTATHGRLALAATVDLGQYGAPVTITVPSSSQVTAIPLSTVEQFLGGFLGKMHLGSMFSHAA